MSPTNAERATSRGIIAFIGTAYALCVALSLLIGLTGGHESPLIPLSYLSMFLPTIAVLFVAPVMNDRPNICWNSFPIRFLPVALFLIPAVLHALMLALMVGIDGGLQWQDWLTKEPDGLYHAPASRGWGVLTIQGLLVHIALNAVVGLIVVSFLALFEEIGWRVWLLPRLVTRIGTRRAVVATSIIWALWHVPFQLSGIQYIKGVSSLGLSLAVVPGTMAAGLILGWLWLRSESIWLVAIAHGASNNWGQYAFKYIKDSGAPDRDMAILGAGSLALLCVGVLLLWHVKSPPGSSLWARPSGITTS